jgi:hypothetical protein
MLSRLLLRTRSESNQSRDGAALRCGRDAGAALPVFSADMLEAREGERPRFPFSMLRALKGCKAPESDEPDLFFDRTDRMLTTHVNSSSVNSSS